jgi:hypothetical protein
LALGGKRNGGTLYVSTDADAPFYDTTQSLSDSDRAEGASLTTLELSTLWAILEGREWDVKMMDEFQCVLEEDDGERSIYRLPAALVSKLTLCDTDTLTRATAQWAQTDEIACDPSDIQPLMETLIRLARRAQCLSVELRLKDLLTRGLKSMSRTLA